jgi:hypothetical protein
MEDYLLANAHDAYVWETIRVMLDEGRSQTDFGGGSAPYVVVTLEVSP